MFCPNCGKPMEENARFCPYCGSPTEGAPAPDMFAQQEQEPKADSNLNAGNWGPDWGWTEPIPAPPQKKKGKTLFIVLAVILGLVLAAAGGVGFVFLQNNNIKNQKTEIADAIEQLGLNAFIVEKENLMAEWDGLKATDFRKRKAVVDKLKTVNNEAENYLQNLEEQRDAYAAMIAAGPEEYQGKKDALLKAWSEEGIADIDHNEAYLDMLQSLSDQAMSAVEEQIQEFASVDMSGAAEAEQSAYQENMSQVQECLTQGDYAQVKTILSSLDEICEPYRSANAVLQMTVRQADTNQFPRVRLYLSAQNEETQESPSDLFQENFSLREVTGGNTVDCSLIRAAMAENGETVNMALVADANEVMEGSAMDTTKNAINAFLDEMNFEAGDMAELISYATGVRLNMYYSNDRRMLQSEVNQITTGKKRVLYDALYAAIRHSADVSGIRSVVVYATGEDTGSSYSAAEIADLAVQCQVPVTVLAAGAVNESDLSMIADRSGGSFLRLSDFGSIQTALSQIYRELKQMYVLEYDAAANPDVQAEQQVMIAYSSREYEGQCMGSFVPVSTLPPEPQLDKNGPEVTVEEYLKVFPYAVTYSDFSMIAPYLLQGGEVWNEQKNYVNFDLYEEVRDYRVKSIVRDSDSRAYVTTEEDFYYVSKGKANTMTQEVRYELVKDEGIWKISRFADFNVLSRG